MLPGGTDPSYRALLASNFAPVSRIEVWRMGVRIDPYGTAGLPVMQASVSATLASRTTRQLSMQTDESHYPIDTSDLLAPYGNEIRAFAGARNFGGADHMWPVFRGRIDTVTLDSGGGVQVDCVDRAAEIGDAYFRIPRNQTAGQPILTVFSDLVTEAVPDAQFGDSDALWEVAPQLTWENDRAAALDDLAKAASSYWFALADGRFVIRRIPWTQAAESVITFTDGPGGSIGSWQVARTRQNVANVVTVFGERSDGTLPVYATASDNNVDSPTYVQGPFGEKGLLVQAQAATTSGQAFAVAVRTLLRARALQETWRTSMVPDAALELGDTAVLSVRGRVARQVVASFTLPLVGTGTELMSVNWRAHEVEDVQED